MKNIAFRADERFIEMARKRALRERSTLEDEFRRWLAAYAGSDERADRALATIADLQMRIRTRGRTFTRDERNRR